MFKSIRQSLGLILFVIALSMLIWGEWHFPRQIKTMTISSAFPTYRLVIEIPQSIRLGDTDIIHLSIAPEESWILPTPTPLSGSESENPSNVLSESELTYNILAETRLEMDGVLFTPTGDIIEPIKPDQMLSIYWTLQPENIGVYQGVVWLHFQYVDVDKNETVRKLISTQLIDIKSEGFLGLRGDVARLLGIIGAVIGLALQFDLWIDIYRKNKQRRRIIIHA